MRKKIPMISGVAIFIMVLTANIQYAIEGYGIGENSLHAEVLAQTSSGGGSGSGTGGWLWEKKKTDSPCVGSRTVTTWICGGVVYYVYVAGCRESTETIRWTGKMTRCDDGWSFCSSGCEGSGTSTGG